MVLWSENALDSKPQKQNDRGDEFEGKWSMFIYMYQSSKSGKNKPMSRIAVVMMELKSNTISDDEIEPKHTHGHNEVHENLWVIKEVGKKKK